MLLFSSAEILLRLKELSAAFARCHLAQDRLELLKTDPLAQQLFEHHEGFSYELLRLSPQDQLLVLEMIVTQQIDAKTPWPQILQWCALLQDAEQFYWEKGGILGYQLLILERLIEQESPQDTQNIRYLRPEGTCFTTCKQEAQGATLLGIKNACRLAEIYPVGGAADRLQFTDPSTQHALPAALLPFLGRSLLEGLVRDLQAREFLYYKLFRKQIHTPIALMTSTERGNHEVIVSLCEENLWFGRRPQDWMFFKQPQVPMVDKEGKWCLGWGGKLLQRPGGHGALWKAAEDQGVFKWLLAHGKDKVLIRQINNPIAGVDFGILGFTGVGFEKNATFGFASCLRQVGVAEGVNVLIEDSAQEEKRYCLTNIEYCDFEKYGIEDMPAEEGCAYSIFPSNTNILFGDIRKLQAATKEHPFPGMILNFKPLTYQDDLGHVAVKEMARLETLMQNIADHFTYPATFITYNDRRKTISTAKKGFQDNKSPIETPHGSYLDYSLNGYDLLKECGVVLPDLVEGRLSPIHFVYHPALGPLYQVITQKISGGKIDQGGELQLEIADLELKNLILQGSLLITAEQVMGEMDETGILHYSDKVGRCFFKNVTVSNLGMDEAAQSQFWKNEIFRTESCEIFLEGESELIAEDVILRGDLKITVPHGKRARLFMQQDNLVIAYETLDKPLLTEYRLLDSGNIALSRNGG